MEQNKADLYFHGETSNIRIPLRKGCLKRRDSQAIPLDEMDGRITQEEVDQILDRIHSIQKPYYRIMTCTIIFFTLAFLCIPVAVILMLHHDAFKDTFQLFGSAVISPVLVTFFTLLILVVFFHYISKKARLSLQDYIERCNKRFTPRGLTWYLPSNLPSFPKWVELLKEYVGRTSNLATYIPPPTVVFIPCPNSSLNPNQIILGDGLPTQYEVKQPRGFFDEN